MVIVLLDIIVMTSYSTVECKNIPNIRSVTDGGRLFIISAILSSFSASNFATFASFWAVINYNFQNIIAFEKCFRMMMIIKALLGDKMRICTHHIQIACIHTFNWVRKVTTAVSIIVSDTHLQLLKFFFLLILHLIAYVKHQHLIL